MKTTIKHTILLASVLMLAACNKESSVATRERDITYTVTTVGTQRAASAVDKTTTVHLTTEAEWQALLDRFCDYAEGGSTVTFRNANRAAKAAAKEAVTYSTTDREAMKRWMAQMEDQGKTVTVTYDPATGTYNGTAYATVPQPQNASSYWVDLGLPSGLLWAKCNLGASQPEDTGYYFAWGETWPKNEYSWATYAHCVNGDDHSITKYSYSTITGYNGYTDTLRVLEPGDDAATVNIGGGAHTPTYHEWEELWDNCTVEWVTQNGENGLRCTGPNGNSIFLPDHGTFSGSSVGVWGFYWTASAAYNIPCPGDIITTGACSYEVRERGQHLFRSNRFIGMSIRPVRSV